MIRVTARASAWDTSFRCTNKISTRKRRQDQAPRGNEESPRFEQPKISNGRRSGPVFFEAPSATRSGDVRRPFNRPDASISFRYFQGQLSSSG